MIAVVFRSKRKIEDITYAKIAIPLMKEVETYEGYIRTIRLPVDDTGWHTTIHYWNNRRNLIRWINSPSHKEVMKRSKEFYHDVEIIIGNVK